MKNRYWVAGICLLVLMLCLLSSCGGGGSSTTSAVTSTPPTKTTSSSSTQTTTSSATTSSTTSGNTLSDILGKGANIASVKYDMTMTIPQSGEVKTTIWQKNHKMREDMTMQGTTTIILFDMDAKIMYTYMPEQNMAMKMTLDSSATPQGSVGDTSSIIDYNPNVVGTESIDGKVCTVITYDIPGSGSMKAWIWKDKGFPLKMEVTSSAGTTTIEYRNIDFSDIPDSTFELPAGVKIVSTP